MSGRGRRHVPTDECEWEFGDGTTATTRETLTVSRELDVEVADRDPTDGLVSVRATAGFEPTDAVAVETLRFGAPTAVAMGSGATPVGREVRGSDLELRFRADESGLHDSGAARLAGHTVDGVGLAGTADPALSVGRSSE